jgi:hypothetical protein
MQSEGVHDKLVEVPHQLQIEDAKPNAHRRTQPGPTNMNQSENGREPMPSMPMYYYHPHHTMHFPPYGLPPYQHTSPPKGAWTSQRELEIPSSDGFEPEDEPTLYPPDHSVKNHRKTGSPRRVQIVAKVGPPGGRPTQCIYMWVRPTEQCQM